MEDIDEEMKLIYGSNTDYITRSGRLLKYMKGKGYFEKVTSINEHNGYVYGAITFTDGNKSRRMHRIIALAFVDNPDTENLIHVGHKNNIKHDNSPDNLYWTTNKDNTQKAFDDGLNITVKGIDNITSKPLSVIEGDKVVAVYGSIREADRNIENLTTSYLSDILKREGKYKPRSRKYIYKPITVEEYNSYDDSFKNKQLVDVTVPKQQSIFKAINMATGEESIHDNQKEFARDNNLNQASISQAIKENSTYNGWIFELIKKTSYKESSAYTNYIDTINEITIENIKTKEVKTFITQKDLKEFFNIKGHDIKQYYKKDQLIFSKWRVVAC